MAGDPAQELAARVVRKLYDGDAFSQWLGIEVVRAAPGESLLRMRVREEMTNGFGVCHGGVTYALADSALAFASNSHGRLSLALSVNMTYPAKVNAGDVLTAAAQELNKTRHTASYDVTITKEDGSVVGLFRGTVYRTHTAFFAEQEGEDKS
jgi:acyl-CoA thioesterase